MSQTKGSSLRAPWQNGPVQKQTHLTLYETDSF